MVRMRLAIMALALCSCSANPKYDCMSAVGAKYATGKYGKLVDGEWFGLRCEIEATPGKTASFYVEVHNVADHWFDGWRVDFTAPAEYEALYLGRFLPTYRPIDL